jgi:hypothetical protein
MLRKSKQLLTRRDSIQEEDSALLSSAKVSKSLVSSTIREISLFSLCRNPENYAK